MLKEKLFLKRQSIVTRNDHRENAREKRQKKKNQLQKLSKHYQEKQKGGDFTLVSRKNHSNLETQHTLSSQRIKLRNCFLQAILSCVFVYLLNLLLHVYSICSLIISQTTSLCSVEGRENNQFRIVDNLKKTKTFQVLTIMSLHKYETICTLHPRDSAITLYEHAVHVEVCAMIQQECLYYPICGNSHRFHVSLSLDVFSIRSYSQ